MREAPIRAVIFDVDGTLVDSNDAHAAAWVEAFWEEGHTVWFADVRKLIGMGGDKLIPAAVGIEATSEQGRRISRRRGEIFRELYLPGIQPFPGVADLVSRLRGDGILLGVASSADRDELGALLERAGAAELAEKATSAGDVAESKPAPDVLEAALARLGCTATEAVFVGDTPYDVAAAGRAGMAVVALLCGGWEQIDLAGAAAVYENVAGMLRDYDSLFGSGQARAPEGSA